MKMSCICHAYCTYFIYIIYKYNYKLCILRNTFCFPSHSMMPGWLMYRLCKSLRRLGRKWKPVGCFDRACCTVLPCFVDSVASAFHPFRATIYIYISTFCRHLFYHPVRLLKFSKSLHWSWATSHGQVPATNGSTRPCKRLRARSHAVDEWY